jgi:hypothetical protein
MDQGLLCKLSETCTQPGDGQADPELEKPVDGDNAFDTLMRTHDGGSGRGESVRSSTKFPLILQVSLASHCNDRGSTLVLTDQHKGHSRTVVGYEEDRQGNINLLIFDPGR